MHSAVRASRLAAPPLGFRGDAAAQKPRGAVPHTRLGATAAAQRDAPAAVFCAAHGGQGACSTAQLPRTR
jgi:hypothetical protein